MNHWISQAARCIIIFYLEVSWIFYLLFSLYSFLYEMFYEEKDVITAESLFNVCAGCFLPKIHRANLIQVEWESFGICCTSKQFCHMTQWLHRTMMTQIWQFRFLWIRICGTLYHRTYWLRLAVSGKLQILQLKLKPMMTL